MNVDVSPDGKQIVFDLLGDIYVLPIVGGEARLIAGGPSLDFHPRYSPRSGEIVFVSDRSGTNALWTMDRNGENLKKLVDGGKWEIRAPAWSSDGEKLVFSWNKPEVPLAFVAVDTGKLEELPLTFKAVQSTGKFNNPVFSSDAQQIYFSERSCSIMGPEERVGRIILLNRATGEYSVLSKTSGRIFKPLVSRSGHWLAFVHYPEKGSATLRLRNLQDGVERNVMTLPDADDPCRWGLEDFLTNYAFTPDEDAVVITAGGKIHRTDLATGHSAVIPFLATVKQILAKRIPPRKMVLGGDHVKIHAVRSPQVSPDGQSLVFTAVGKVWLQDIKTRRVRRLTSSEELEYAPVISPDGRWLAYLSYIDKISSTLKNQTNRRLTLTNRVMVIDLHAGTETTPHAITEQPGDYGEPLWFPSSDRLLYTQLEVNSAKPNTVRARFVRADVAGKGPRPMGLAPPGWEYFSDNMMFNNLFSRRISPDGARAYYMDLGKGGKHLSLISIRIADGEDKHTHLTFPGYGPPIEARDPGQGAALSPDLRHLLISPGRGTGLFVIPVPVPNSAPTEYSFIAGSAHKITDNAVTGLSWQHDKSVMYANGSEITRINLSATDSIETWDLGLSLPRAKPQGTLAIRNARLITMQEPRGQERVIEDGVILVRDGTIVKVGDSKEIEIPPWSKVIDVHGMTVIPGLADMHMHARLRAWPRPVVDTDDISTLAFGVTLRFDAGSTSGAIGDMEHDERIRTGASIGPRYFYAGDTVRGGSGRTTGDDWTYRSLQDCRNLVNYWDKQRVVILKITGKRLSRKEQKCWAQAAREVGLGITAHTEGMLQVISMMADGFTAWEHAKYNTPLYKDVLTLAAQSGIQHSSTLGLLGGDAGYYQGWNYYYSELKKSPKQIAKLERFFSRNSIEKDYNAKFDVPFETLYLNRMAKSVAAMLQAGVNVSVDGHNPPGILTHWAMWTLKDGGATNMQALRASTRQGAEKLGVDAQLGSLEVGKLADFVVLSANPLEDIRNSTKIKYVVKNGFVYEGDTMAQVWPERRQPPAITAVPDL